MNADSLMELYIHHIGHVAASVVHATELITALRASRPQPDIYAYLEELTLDLLKYRIRDAIDKTPAQRALERLHSRANEHPDLARRFRLPSREALAQTVQT